MISINENSFQYIKDHLIKFDWNIDEFGNIVSKKVTNEPHSVAKGSDGKQYVILNKIADTNATVIVNNKLDILSSKSPTFIGYKQVNSMANFTSNDQFYFDKENFRIYFNGVSENQNVEITYYAFGKVCLSANMIYTEWDSNGNIIKLLGELVRESKTALTQIQGITNAESVRIQLDAQVKALTNMFYTIQNYVPEAKSLSQELDVKVPNASIAVNSINTALTNAQNAINTISMADNQYYTIPADQLVYNSATTFYEYTLTHNLNSLKLIMSIVDDDGDELVDLGHRIDNNNYLIANDEKVNIHVIVNKGYYQGA
jgi:hypothetical protein